MKKDSLSNLMDSSLIITTYNWPEALKITLESVLKQSIKPYEIIIADDGSGSETGQVIEDLLNPAESVYKQ